MFRRYRIIIDEIREENSDHEIVKIDDFFSFHIFSYLKFFDNYQTDEDEKNFYFEREWRIIGNLKFSKEDVSTVLMPKKYATKFREDCPEYNGQLIFVD